MGRERSEPGNGRMIITVKVFGTTDPRIDQQLLNLVSEAVKQALPANFAVEAHSDPLYDRQKELHAKHGGRVTVRGLIVVRMA